MTEQTISAEELCALTGLTDRRHRQLAKDGYFPPPEESHYQTIPTLRGLFQHYRKMSETRGDLADEKLGKIAAERKLAELQLAREKREVLIADDVERAWQYAFSAARGRWQQLPSKAEVSFPLWKDARACSDWLEDEVTALLQELAEAPDYSPQVEEDEDDAQSGKAA
jgi:hypothetical protein